MSRTLAHWLRLLWGQSPSVHLHSDAPFIAAGAIHLPAWPPGLQLQAAAAHAAAHLVYSRSASSDRRAGYDVSGLGPIARALLALLEDARAEALACRELPGLARLWRPLHTATPHDGTGFEALMRRLARALADPSYEDPHPWVRKGVGLFYLDADLRLLALRTPTELRGAALRLGHDIGQMRLPFDSRNYRPAPAYRDDHRWMWPADALAEAGPSPSLARPLPEDDAPCEEGDPMTGSKVTHHPEWDRLIARLRPAWCRVIEQSAPDAPPGSAADVERFTVATDETAHRLQRPLRALAGHAGGKALLHEGEVFDLDALLQAGLDRRMSRASDARLYRASPRRAVGVVVCVLVDQSASTAARVSPETDRSILQLAVGGAWAIAKALQDLGFVCTVAGFSSNGRHAVRVLTVKQAREPVDAKAAARLHALRPGGSTRLGTALRHAAAACAAASASPRAARWVLLLSDGQAHDVDAHDPHYLVEDARHAVRAAKRRAVRVACVGCGEAASGDAARARHIFGRAGVQPLGALEDLPRVLRKLLS